MRFGRRRRFRLTVDGVATHYRTLEEARAAAPERLSDDYERWTVDEQVGGKHGRYFNRACGWRGGTTSTADLARMGVPINPASISERPL